jgi:hypothetical protein
MMKILFLPSSKTSPRPFKIITVLDHELEIVVPPLLHVLLTGKENTKTSNEEKGNSCQWAIS